MANYDGAILINTKINVKSAEVQLSALENKMLKAANKVADLKSKMDTLKNTKVPTEGYAKLQADLEKAQAELTALVQKQEEFSRIGVTSGTGWDELNEQIAAASDRIDDIKAAMYEMEQSGNAYIPGGAENTAEYAELARQLQYAENELRLLNEQHDLHEMKLKRAQDAYRRVGDAAKKGLEKANKEVKKSRGFIEKFFRRVKGLAERVFIFSFVTRFFRGIVNGIKSGFSNFYNYSESFKNSADSLKASLSTLSNSFAAAFAPLVETAIPYIQKLIDYITRLLGLFAQFTALITGQKTYTRAIKQTAAATKEASKAAEGYLSPLDEINKFQKKDTGEEGAVDPKTMFEEVPINTKLLDFFDKIAGYLGKLKDIFMQGFWDGLGDWQYRWESIKDSIASIKESLKDIWTDPAVLAAADKWAQSVAYMLGSLAGSMASIGLTIATNLLGGIAMYLEGNKDRIKGYLVSMFDIWAEINYMLSDLFQSIAYVFEAFASENGQRLTANLIGIFADAFMGVTELASEIGRDILNIFIQPFVDSRDAFRTALEGFLGVLADVAGTIKDGIDETFDKLNEVYDAHFKPFFDSVAQGLSDLVGEFLAFWNDNVQPILDQMAADFDELWKTHVQPLINDAIELLGRLADLLKMIWNEILVPFVSWVIENVLPKILPIIQGVWDALKEAVGWALDIFDSIIDKLGDFIDWLTEHKSIVEDFIIVIGSFIAAFEVVKLVTSIAGIVSALAAFATGGGLATAAATALSGALGILGGVIAFLTSPIGLVVAAIGTIIAVFALLYKHSEKFREFVNNIADAAADIVPGIIEGIKSGWKSFTEWLGSLWEEIVNGFKSFFGIHSPSTLMAEMGSMLVLGLIDGITGLVESVTQIWEEMKKTASQKWEEVKQNLSEKMNDIKDDTKDIMNRLKENWSDSWDKMKDSVSSAMDKVKKTIKSATEWISDKLKSISEKISNVGKKASNLSKSSSRSSGSSRNTESRIRSLNYGPALSSPVPQALASLADKEFPGYATGTVIPRTMQKHLAWLGDNNQETEVVSPISTMKQAFVEAITELGGIGGNKYDVKAYAKGRALFELIIEEGKNTQLSTGKNPFLL